MSRLLLEESKNSRKQLTRVLKCTETLNAKLALDSIHTLNLFALTTALVIVIPNEITILYSVIAAYRGDSINWVLCSTVLLLSVLLALALIYLPRHVGDYFFKYFNNHNIKDELNAVKFYSKGKRRDYFLTILLYYVLSNYKDNILVIDKFLHIHNKYANKHSNDTEFYAYYKNVCKLLDYDSIIIYK